MATSNFKQDHGLGTVRLRHEHTNDILLIPAPSSDDRDPLNWPQWYKYYIAGLTSWAIFLSTFGAAGPAVVLTDMTISFFGEPGPYFLQAISKTAYLFTVPALMMGMCNIVWVPLMVKFGRRPVYVFAFLLYSATGAWCAVAQSYGSMLAARVLMGFACGAGEVLGPVTISDIFFVHERGTMMVIYTCTLSAGTSIGALVSGLVTINDPWRVIFWITCGLTGATAILMIFTLPETIFERVASNVQVTLRKASTANIEEKGEVVEETFELVRGHHPSISTVVRTLPIKAYTSESMLMIAVRPLVLIILPSALWASLVLAVSIGFLVAMSSNISTAFGETYGFETWQIGVSMISGAIGSFSAFYFGGPLSDIIADFLTRRNGGIREPEMRLPAMAISLVTGPLALILYGLGIGMKLHWMCPVMGMALINFTIVQAGNICVVYMIDCYRPITGEITMTQYTFKSLFGFLLSFYTNDWISQSGYVRAFSEMAAISGAVFLSTFVFYFYGKRLRRLSWNWPVMKIFLHWKVDREVGE